MEGTHCPKQKMVVRTQTGSADGGTRIQKTATTTTLGSHQIWTAILKSVSVVTIDSTTAPRPSPQTLCSPGLRATTALLVMVVAAPLDSIPDQSTGTTKIATTTTISIGQYRMGHMDAILRSNTAAGVTEVRPMRSYFHLIILSFCIVFMVDARWSKE